MIEFLRILWALPATCVGVIAAIPFLVTGARGGLRDGALEVGGGKLARALERWRFGAITFGHVIIGLDDACLGACRAHEHVHVRQYERWGLLFFPLYVAFSAWAWLRGRDAYRENRFEREAFSSACAYPDFRVRGPAR